MRRFFAELRRRRVFRTAAYYVVGAWLALQVADVLFPALEISDQSIRYLFYAGVLGFPLALVFGWFFDISPDGIHRTGPAADGEFSTQQELRRKDYILLGVLAAVLAAILYGTLANVGLAPERQLAQDKRSSDGPPILAVLPFTSTGDSDESDFFARGVHDDLITRLAGLANLRVISRTSVLEHDTEGKRIPEIGRELGVDAVLEGSIQVAGEQMRINVLLVDAGTEEDLWAQSFDRLLTASNIFAIQADIATAISGALQSTLSPAEAAQLSVMPTENMAAYRAYHEAMRLQEAADGRPDREGRFLAGLERAIELDPAFTRPMTELVEAIAQRNFNRPDPAAVEYIESLIDRLRESKPNSVEHLTAQAYYAYYIVKDYDMALRLLDQARSLSPSNTRLLDVRSWVQRRTGDTDGWIESIRLARQIEPGNPVWLYRLVPALMMVHRYGDALEEVLKIEDPNFSMSEHQAILRMQEHRDLARYRADIEAVVEDADVGIWDAAYSLWEVELALGNDAAARAARVSVADPDSFDGETMRVLPVSEEKALIEAVVVGDETALKMAVDQARVTLGLDADMVGFDSLKAWPVNIYSLSLALVLIGEENPEQAEQILHRYQRELRGNFTGQMMTRHSICRLYGLADAAGAAVDCLRAGLAEPSYVTPFLEPLLPYYRSIRDTPEFRGLVAELQAEGWLAPAFP